MKTQHEAASDSERIRARSGGPAAVAPRAREAPPDGGPATNAPHAQHLTARQLEAVFVSMADGIIFSDRDGHIRATNPAVRRLLALDARPDFEALALAEQVRLLRARDALGHPIREEQMVSWGERVLAGETLSGTDIGALTVRALDGRDVELGVTAAPVRDAHGAIVGTVWIARDVTELRQLGRRTREALTALVAMVEMLVTAGPSASGTASDASPGALHSSDREAAASAVAQRLAQLTLTVVGCRQLDVVVEGGPQRELRLVASAGLTAQELRRWRAVAPWRSHRLRDLLPPDLAARLERGEGIPIDFADPAWAQVPTPAGVHSGLLTPMRLGGRLVGFLALGRSGPDAHTFAPEEVALAAGTARLAALVIERERLLREREEARASALALREANRRMDDFLAVAAHELRAPVMAGLIGVELAQRRVRALQATTPASEGELATEIDELAEVLAQSTESVERLAHLVTTLLDVSRMQAGQLEIHPVPTDLATIVREAVARQQLLVPARAIHLHLPASGPVPVLVDPDRIGEVVANFVSNALKYAPEDRPVEVHVQVRGGRARVSVRDEGPGLPIEEQRRIWDRYHQAASIRANSGSSAGMGLGLYIAREIVRAHGGKVGVRSSPGKGATFWFTLPLDGTA